MSVETKHTYVCDCCQRRSETELPFEFSTTRHIPLAQRVHNGIWGTIAFSESTPASKYRDNSGTYCTIQCAQEGLRVWLLMKDPDEKPVKKGLFGRKGK